VSERVGHSGVWRVDAAGVLVIAAIAATWYAVGLRPVLEARAAADVEASELDASLRELSAAEHEVMVTRERLENLSKRIAAASLQLRPAAGVNARIDALASAAGSAGLRLDTIRPGDAVATSRYTAVPIRIEGVGSYQTCVSLLRTLRKGFPDIGVTGFELRAVHDPAETRARFVFDLVWFAAPGAAHTKKD
jgi:Tfp pilus assembly protein PilO